MLREGNALMNVGFAVASVGGAALAGLVSSHSGLSPALWIDAASFLSVPRCLPRPPTSRSVDVDAEPFGERISR